MPTQSRGILFDRPEVVEQARQAFIGQGLASRVRFVGGSFLEAVPDGGDLYLLKNVLCDWDDENCAQILSRCRDAVDADTPLVFVDWRSARHRRQNRRSNEPTENAALRTDHFANRRCSGTPTYT
ncbi:hypothetical protein FDZ84_25120 [Saccharopolyspora sp. ASAGF58]|nr:hypothetical protein FDZ84_25120 [Saccharopolyspora sp. ASAGF58]